MRRYAGSRDAALTRRRIAAGTATALAVTFTFVSANAIWYQPHAHKSPILATRAVEPGPVPAPVPVDSLFTRLRARYDVRLALAG